jgi:hypothetical protein
MAQTKVEAILRRHQDMLAKMRVKTNAGFGRLGERGNVTGVKQRIPSATGTAAFRIPDALTPHELIEVKNVSRLRLTWQITDFLMFCRDTERMLVLYVRPDVSLTNEMLHLVNSGEITLRPRLRIFSAKAQETLSRALRPLIEKALLRPAG